MEVFVVFSQPHFAPLMEAIATAIVKKALLHESYGPKYAKSYPLFLFAIN
jgi:hypothetical protein